MHLHTQHRDFIESCKNPQISFPFTIGDGGALTSLDLQQCVQEIHRVKIPFTPSHILPIFPRGLNDGIY